MSQILYKKDDAIYFKTIISLLKQLQHRLGILKHFFP